MSDIRYVPLNEEGFQRLKPALPEETQWESLETLPRPVVMRFAREMEKKLKANDYKSGWERMSFAVLIRRLKEETKELERALGIDCEHCGQPMSKGNSEDVNSESADVANFAMFIFDNASRRKT